MTTDDIFKIIDYATNKNQNGSLKAEDFNRILPLAESGFISYLLGSFQTYQVGRPISKVELGQNSVVRQRLSPIIKRANLTVDGAGFSPYPTRYIQADAMWTDSASYKRIRWCDQDRWYSKVNSVIDKVLSKPIYMINDTGFEFAPRTIGTASLSFIQQPLPITWAFTLDVNQRRVYDAVNSVQPVWNDVAILEIIVRALALVGINLQLRVVENYSQIIKTQGQ
jgi:hypothetical protein